MKLMILWGSSRTGRKGGIVVDWVKAEVAKDSRFEVDFIDFSNKGFLERFDIGHDKLESFYRSSSTDNFHYTGEMKRPYSDDDIKRLSVSANNKWFSIMNTFKEEIDSANRPEVKKESK